MAQQRSGSVVQTFLFADLSGFTALTEAHGDEQAADLVGGFCGAVRGLWPPIRPRRSRASATR
jgi:class 3 adenylate cyclase